MKNLTILFYSFVNWLFLTANNTVDTIGSLTQNLPDVPNPENLTKFEEVVKLVLSIAGGILSSIILSFLSRKFPKLFASSTFRRKKNKDLYL